MPGTTFLRGDSVTLTTVGPDDYSDVAALHNDPANREQAGISTPLYESGVAELIEERDDTVLFLVCHDGEAVGTAILSEIDTQARRAELGYIIQQAEQGRGYATAGAALCIEHAFDDRDLQKVWAQVNDDNEASKRVLEKLGFQQEGLLRNHEYASGKRVDVCRYGLLSAEWETPVDR